MKGFVALTAALCMTLLLCACGAAKTAPAPEKELVAHDYPESLLSYEAKQQSAESIDLSQAAVLEVNVNHCEYGEPTQTISDPETVAEAVKAVSGITVTDGPDSVSSTGTHYVFCFRDAAGEYICSFAFQDGMLMENEGRLPLSGLSELLSVDGVMLDEQWEEYWDACSEAQDRYDEAFQAEYPGSVFDFGGYWTSLAGELAPEELVFAYVRVSWNDEAGELQTADAQMIGDLVQALQGMRVTGPCDGSPGGQTWFVTLSFYDPSGSFAQSCTFRFQGDCLVSELPNGNDAYYRLEGLDAFFDAADSEVLEYLKLHRMDAAN